MIEVDGRFRLSGLSSVSHVLASNPHSASENPEDGLSGRSPWMTLKITVSRLAISLNGQHPVMTCWEMSLIFPMSKGMLYTHLKDCHPKRIDVRALGWKLFFKLSGKSILLGIK